MPTATETFDLGATVNLVWQALSAIICNVGLQVAAAGLFACCVLAVLSWILLRRGKRTGKPLFAVAKKISLICIALGLPGFAVLTMSGHLPPVNQLTLNPFGLVGFWALVSAHMCMEEMNYEWFFDK